ncbi:pentapeptide repeat-containing protein [Shewanella baltica]|uniref:pentapeptide repeat-containing protein n=1 Tax=Shewanella baltica TaxID=62322 RepID=UPI00217D091E|nr:pentapeptide repeat-containing protein [Shewanella baltica]MCS6234481.1 pentapeptide repeat-containing protein [Shewanella baltica]MCS6268876.1 pentapeptide repeat-containing protein [Shewanella baltica]
MKEIIKFHDITIKKPVSFWNQELNLSPKEFFFSLGKTAISATVLDSKGVAENLLETLKSITPQKEASHAAWMLIYKSLLNSLTELVLDYKDFFSNEINENLVDTLADNLDKKMSEIEIGFDASFFDRPDKITFLYQIEIHLKTWLMSLGMLEPQTNAFYLRLKTRFALALHEQWLKSPSDYTCIQDALNSPFTKATLNERGWMLYGSWLQEQVNNRLFSEAFSLSQIYVPLRAYFEENDNNHEIADNELVNLESDKKKKISRFVVNLHTEMEKWVKNFNKDDAVKIISGGPGSGKSSFGKMFAAFVARELTDISVIFVPLHHFDLTDDLTSSVKKFVSEDKYLSGNPLDASEGKERLLIIFDGLDELSMQGKASAESALYFVDEVTATIDKYNAQGAKRQVLITGRDLAVQSASLRLRGKRKILHVLPYFISKEDFNLYNGDKNLLKIDQRIQWWKNYSTAKGLSSTTVPSQLEIERLTPITREPLLNYLVAMSYERNKINFSNNTTLNNIYHDLLTSVHERQWDHGRHAGAKHLEIEQFIRVLEEIALAVWHGDGRTTTVDRIFKQCKNNNLERYLEVFQEGAKSGVTKLLTAFYFRQSDQLQAGDKTFEFTHKSFGEYLTSRRIVRSINLIHSGLIKHEEDPDEGFGEKEALKRWIELCGKTEIDEYIFKFLQDEIASYPDKTPHWQKTFSRLLSAVVRNGTPMEEITEVTKFNNMMRQSRNAEESLLAVYHACTTNKSIPINWGDNKSAVGQWLKRLQGQRHGPANTLTMKSLSYLDLSSQFFEIFDFYAANMEGTSLQNSHLTRSTFDKANLKNANLANAHAYMANFAYANLINATLANAVLRRTNFHGAKLQGAKLQGAKLEDASLQGAKLEDACLQRANLEGANLQGASLQGANLQGANLQGASLQGANLQGANLQGANLQGANLEGANLEGANLREANLQDAKLKGTKLPIEIKSMLDNMKEQRKKRTVTTDQSL